MEVLAVAALLLPFSWWSGWVWTRKTSLLLSERVWLAGVLGLFFLEVIATFLCFAGWLTRGAVLMSLGLPAGISLSRFFVPVRAPRRNGSAVPGDAESESPSHLLFVLSLAVCVGIGIHTLLCALTPEVRSDPVRYHISMANQYAVREGIEPLRENVWWSIPQYAECLYALGITLSNDTLSKLFHWWAGVLSTLGVFALADRWFGKKPAWWAVLLWVTTPKVSYEATTTYVELLLTVWIEVSVWAALQGLSSRNPSRQSSYLILSGFALGMGFGTKYTALGVQGVPWFVFLGAAAWRCWQENREKFYRLGYPLLAVFLADSVWLLRNVVHTGNPVYPLYNRFFGLNNEYDRGAELFFMTVWPGRAVFRPSFYFERLEGLLLSGYLFPAFTLLCGLFLVLVRGSGVAKKVTGPPYLGWISFIVASLAAYLVLTGNLDGRFWLPTLGIFVPFLGWGVTLIRTIPTIAESRYPDRVESMITTGLLLLCLLNYVGQRLAFFRDFKESPLPILSAEARWSYYRSHNRGDPDGLQFERLLPEGSLVYSLGFPHRVRSISPVVEWVVDSTGRRLRSNEDPVLFPFLDSEGTPKTLLRTLQKVGVDFLVLPADPEQRNTDFWRTAQVLCRTVPGSNGRLLKVPRAAAVENRQDFP